MTHPKEQLDLDAIQEYGQGHWSCVGTALFYEPKDTDITKKVVATEYEVSMISKMLNERNDCVAEILRMRERNRKLEIVVDSFTARIQACTDDQTPLENQDIARPAR